MNTIDTSAPPLHSHGGLVHGLGVAAVIMTSFGFVWLGWGFGVLPNFSLWQWIAYYVVALVLFVVSARRMIAGAKLIKRQGLDRREYLKSNAKPFGVITATEVAGCGIVVALAYGLHHAEFIAPGVGVVVGLHFFPLAKLFKVPAYFATGAIMVVADLAAAALCHGDGITAAAGISNGAVLWVTAIYVLALSRK